MPGSVGRRIRKRPTLEYFSRTSDERWSVPGFPGHLLLI